MPDRPNVLFMMSDQHHANCLGCYGNRVIKTPHHDWIAREGVRFTRAYANSPICNPSRTSFLSGLYVHQHGNYGNTGTDPGRARWMTDQFRENGYTVAGVGKMHMGNEWLRSQMDYVRNENLFDAPADDPLGEWGAHYHRYLLEQGVWEDCGHFYDPEKPIPEDFRPYSTWRLGEEHSQEAWTGREAIRYLRQRDRARPFFLHVSFPRPHDPLLVPSPFDTMYDPADIPPPPNHHDRFEGRAPGLRERYEIGRRNKYPFAPDDPEELREAEVHYYGLISLNDKYFGLILDELRGQNVLDETIIVFTSDHGDFAGEHGMHFKNLGIYEPVHRIPLMIRYPSRIPAESVFDGTVESIDLYPTLCELAGIPVPDDLPGQQVVSAAVEGLTWQKDTALCEGSFWGKDLIALRTEQARLIYCGDTDFCELYDLTEDPWEMRNVWGSAEHASLREEMLRLLQERRTRPVERQKGPPMHPADTFGGAMIRGRPVAELERRFGLRLAEGKKRA